MSYKIDEVLTVKTIIQETLIRLNEMGIVDIDLELVDLDESAFRAIYSENYEGVCSCDSTSEVWRRGVKLVCCAVYRDGSPVLDENTEIVCPECVGRPKDGV